MRIYLVMSERTVLEVQYSKQLSLQILGRRHRPDCSIHFTSITDPRALVCLFPSRMCGILAILGDEVCDNYVDNIKKLNEARGPDYSSPFIECKTRCDLRLRIAASVLHLRGNEIAKQPVLDEQANILLFNGQIYQHNKQILDEDISDTIFLAKKLAACNTKDDIAHILSRIDGPFAIIYWSNSLGCLFYGRDFFGRKSLCVLYSGSSRGVPTLISSVGSAIEMDLGKWQEVDSRGFHCLDFSQKDNVKRTFFVWNIDNIYPPTDKCEVIKICSNTDIKQSLEVPLSKLNQDLRLSHSFEDSVKETALCTLERLLLGAVEKRLKFNRKLCLICRQERPRSEAVCNHSKVALAFSGGIDSTMIALALHRVLCETETIDLITVAFKDESPDRLSVNDAFRELCRLCPNRTWRLVICDISLQELQLERRRIIRHLILPCMTVLDDGLGCGCWFIARARGRSIDSSLTDSELNIHLSEFLKFNPNYSQEQVSDKINTTYESPASMLFAGMGIDEQLGGYTSHRVAWSKRKTQGVLDEISFQMRRIPTRNLGRDDRTFSHHGRDVKLPFLDYDLVSFLNDLPIGLKMNLDESQQTGSKKLLRELAQMWGLEGTSFRVKRALQFGTRIACLEDTSEKGGDICSRLE